MQVRKEGEAETYGPIQRVSKREGEEKKGRKLSVPKREDEECPLSSRPFLMSSLVRSPDTLFPRQGNLTEVGGQPRTPL